MTTSEETRDPLPVIPDVTLYAEIARGGMGVVYRGRQDFLDRDVAVKLLSPELQGAQFAARFRREAKILAGIKHPNIVGCHMAGTTSTGQSYLVMEFVDGPNLRTWIAEHGALALPAALRLARQLASALSHAAEQGVIHRDVKPENILLEAPTSTSVDVAFPFVPKLVDLGLARMTHETGDLALTVPGSVMGTPVTMAPEQFDDPDSVDFRADVYGLGCVLYQMLTGAPAFESTQLTDIVVEKRRPTAPDPCDRRADLPAAVGQLVATMLASDRDDRPASYRELIARLDELAAGVARGTLKAKPAGADEGSRQKLLQTAEFEFLADGGGIGGGSDPSAFPDPTGVPSAAAVDSRPAEDAPTARTPRRRGRRALLVGAVAIAVLVAAVVGAKRLRRNGARPSDTPPAPSTPRTGSPRSHGVAIGGLDGAIRPDVPIELRAELSDPDVEGLRCRWTVRPANAARLAAPDAASTVLQIEGLPGDELTVGLEVGDGRADPLRVTRELVLDYAPLDLLADFVADDTAWSTPNRTRRSDWTRDAENGAVSCAAPLAPGFRARGIPGHVWRVTGQLRPERGTRLTYAQTAACLRIGPARSLAVLCEREGESGEQWSVSLQEVDHEDRRGGFTYRPLRGEPKAVLVVDEDGALAGASFSITRRGGDVVFTVGFPDIDQVVEHRERIRPDADSVMLILYSRRGLGVFPKLELW